MQFTKLRLTGFKSFVDGAELLIEPGLTGIVGPNGCGKSNLVEALRWVMGETSARRMRGTEMEDVIFGGTATRPARNIAEVVLTLHNHRRTAPHAFNHHEFLEITRRIERGTGSDYRINGKNVRARDVQILFADHASGATSPALVSQGRVGAVIAAKPTQRRDILEEAAGISGLHARRHEAELRLKAAEGNLERVEDILKTMQVQSDGLQKQARQAARYRAINETIRQAEALVLHIRWLAGQADQGQARLAFDAAEAKVRDLMTAALGLQAQHQQHQDSLPPLRQAEQAAQQQLHRITVAIEQNDAAQKQTQATLDQAKQRLAQLHTDLGRAGQIDADAAAACARLEAERAKIIQHQQDESAQDEAAHQQLTRTQAEADQQAQTVQSLTEKLAEAEAHMRAARQNADDRQQQARKIADAIQQAIRQQQQLNQDAQKLADSAGAEQTAQQAEQQLHDTQEQQQQLEQQLASLVQMVDDARSRRDQDQLELRRLNSDIEALEKLLKSGNVDPAHRPVVDHITVAAGYELALAAALAEGLEAGLEKAAPRHWGELGRMPLNSPPFWPACVVPLAQFITADAVLTRALSHIGLVEATDKIADITRQLKPGQIVVTRAGDVWRWDGLYSSASVSGRAAQRLEQKNRLVLLQTEQTGIRAQAESSQQHFVHQQRALEQARIQEQQLRQSVRQFMTQADQARRTALAAMQARLDIDGRILALSQRLEDLHQDAALAEQAVQDANAAVSALPDIAAYRGALDAARAGLAHAQQALLAARQQQERVQREAFGRRKRLETIQHEINDWHKRRAQSEQHRAELLSRQQTLNNDIAALSDQPARLLAERQELMLQRDAAAQQQKRTHADLQQTETQAREIAHQLKQTEQQVADAREARARAETGVSLARQAAENLIAEIQEKLSLAPDQLLAFSGHHADKPLPALKDQEQKWQKLLRERDNLGAVNMRAEEESAALALEIKTLTAERDDLTAAIGRLRQGIGRLNKEAREKLLAAFDVVNGHFQQLFVRLFGGGRAHLALTEAEDPLDAGLEIYASPPGKKLQHLSLLSGGEQALTAVALIFSVFLTNPSPICVLDEVDAPLDEANVDRFCTMLEEMASSTGTRFLVISHHRLTMARMHRLFGVTMSERGISRLVSVDLAGAQHALAG